MVRKRRTLLCRCERVGTRHPSSPKHAPTHLWVSEPGTFIGESAVAFYPLELTAASLTPLHVSQQEPFSAAQNLKDYACSCHMKLMNSPYFEVVLFWDLQKVDLGPENDTW